VCYDTKPPGGEEKHTYTEEGKRSEGDGSGTS